MELKEFIKVTLRDVASAISESQEELQELGCFINPPLFGESVDYNGGKNKAYKVEFNLALSAEDKEVNKAGIGIVNVIKAGISSESLGASTTNTNMKFEIFVCWPMHSTEKFNEIKLKSSQGS